MTRPAAESRWGIDRVAEPRGSLPQAAWRLDPSLPGRPHEIVVDVDRLNVDAASFRQLREAHGDDEDAVGAAIASIVRERGKMQNPVTGSGGVLRGTVRSVGPAFRSDSPVAQGDRIVSLVSLTLSPLVLHAVHSVDLEGHQVAVTGHAILWSGCPFGVLPDDLDEDAAMAAMDVCGAPAAASRLVSDASRALVIGTGKSGVLVAAALRRRAGNDVFIAALDTERQRLDLGVQHGVLNASALADARDAAAVRAATESLFGDELPDLVFDCTNVAGAEMGAVLSARDGGTVYFFNMATDFGRAALGAEGLGRDVDLRMVNGYVPGHAELALSLLRDDAFVAASWETLGHPMRRGAHA